MARKKPSVQTRTATLKTDDEMMVMENSLSKPMIAPIVQRLMIYLGLVTMIVWFVIGLYFLPIIYTSVKSGQYFASLGISRSTASPEPTTPSTTEATLPGIGKVNIACAQNALPVEALQKIVADKNVNSLTDEQRKKFEPCVTEKDTSSPAPTTAGQ